jgi:superfamily II DNA/RNA helicase
VQAGTIPVALKGQDILASAQTGSGKTIAYSLPLIINLLTNRQHLALILTPTRELAAQVHQMLTKLLGPTSRLKTVLLIGGAPMFKQIMTLRSRPQLIIGTPGRVNDHLENGSLDLKETRFLILDEADRMLDMGFGIQLDRIAEYLPAERQTLMFSATLPPNIEKLSKKYLREPQRISIDAGMQEAPKIQQETLRISTAEKFSHLMKQLEQREGSIIIFVKTKRGTERLARELQRLNQSAEAIHGDLHQRRRESVIRAFRSRKCRILVATDVAARGLDIPHVMHVINFDLPQCPEDYVHRIGRTGRAGAEGHALSFISPEDNHKWKMICRLLNPHEKPPAMHSSAHDKPSGNGPKPRKRPFFKGAPFKGAERMRRKKQR